MRKNKDGMERIEVRDREREGEQGKRRGRGKGGTEGDKRRKKEI